MSIRTLKFAAASEANHGHGPNAHSLGTLLVWGGCTLAVSLVVKSAHQVNDSTSELKSLPAHALHQQGNPNEIIVAELWQGAKHAQVSQVARLPGCACQQ